MKVILFLFTQLLLSAVYAVFPLSFAAFRSQPLKGWAYIPLCIFFNFGVFFALCYVNVLYDIPGMANPAVAAFWCGDHIATGYSMVKNSSGD